MQDNTAFKVGIVSFILALAIGALLIWKSGLFLKASGYQLVGQFNNVGGLLTGAEVRYRGYKVGKVFKVQPLRGDIKVYFWVNPGLEIPKGSILRVVFDGLVGEKYLAIRPNENATELVKEGDVLEGYASPGLADAVEVGTHNLEQTEAILKHYRGILTSKEVSDSITNTLISFSQTAKELNGILKKLNEVSNLSSLNDTLESFKKTAQSLNQMADRLNNTVANEETAQNINKIVANLAQFTEGLKSFTTTGNGTTKSGISGPMSMIKTISAITVAPEASMQYSTLQKSASYLVQADINLSDSFLRIGAGDTWGSTQILNLQKGFPLSSQSHARVGLVESYPGVGLDYNYNPNVSFSVDVFNINDVQAEIQGRLKVSKQADAFIQLSRDPGNTSSYSNLGVGIAVHPE